MSTDIINVVTNHGDVLPLRANKARSGNTYWATLARKANGERYFTKYGVSVTSSVISELPQSVEVAGITVPLTLDVTEKGQRRVRGAAKVTIGEGKDKVEKNFTVRITEMGPETFNLSASIRGASSGGPRLMDEL